MLYSLALPPYESIKALEGSGNFAVKKYYQFPYSFFYQKKLKMVLGYLKSRDLAILDFGCGEARILELSLGQYPNAVYFADKTEDINTDVKYDVIICSSVLEFVDLKYTLKFLKTILKPTGYMIVASPMSTLLTETYFTIIGDPHTRNSHQLIYQEVSKIFRISEYKEWLGLYFSFKCKPS